MELNKRTDEGVSPVVGVILMVAITVILSAVITTFVLDLGGTVSQNPQAGVTFDENSSAGEVEIQVVTMDNADSVHALSSSYPDTEVEIGDVGSSVIFSTTIGSDDGDYNPGDKLTVTATLEGKTQVIQTYTTAE